jgi:Kef-type K+ transport system membrane component KefB
LNDSNPELIAYFLLQMGVMLAVGLIFGQLMRKIHQPAVLGELLGGIVLGPTIFGALFPAVHKQLFPGLPEIVAAREVVIRIGMLFFMFAAGLEINLSHLGRNKKSIILVSLSGLILPFALGIGSVYLLPTVWHADSTDPDPNLVLFIGIALSISALPVITRILMDLRLIQEKFGAIAITSAAIDDITGWSLFALLLNSLTLGTGLDNSLLRTVGVIILLTLVVFGIGRITGKYLFRWVRKSLVWPSGFLGVSAVFIFVSAAIAETLHVHAIFGAFLIGMALIPVFKENEADHAQEIIHQFAVSFFAPLYFVSVGLKADFAANFDLPLVVLVLALAIIGKVVGATIGARIGGISPKESLAIGFTMNARGAMEMILASVALEFGLIDQRIFVALVTMALVTSMMSGPLLQWLLKFPLPAKTRVQSPDEYSLP